MCGCRPRLRVDLSNNGEALEGVIKEDIPVTEFDTLLVRKRNRTNDNGDICYNT